MISLSMFSGVWRYRGFVLGSVKREFQSKYRNSLFGAVWTVLNPLAMVIVYTVIFSEVMGSRLQGVDSTFAYSIYLCAGALTWGLFAEITTRGQTVFLENANLIKKLQFPRICLPIIVVLNAGINFAIIFGLFTIFMVLSGTFPGWIYFALYPVLLLQILFSIGLGMVLGVLNVFFRDVGQFFTILLQFWFWFTPIVYPASALPPAVRELLVFNPMAGVIGAYQTILVKGQMPDWASLLPIAVLTVLCCVMGLLLFRKRAGEMVDEL
ncbi:MULTISPECIES: ABC transporter permease [Massilia]|uniref:Transport permease protein n=1 Tax=Massilia violaceinigra TaxID=2045208 RepID=A0A2D2DK69_9BURK|nr:MULTISPECIES: ABC transporter permease [Massilia]ATQ75371.1 ABC transporter [Massilia violaceinigra]MDQ1817508.1 ABC transporter permease [Massilia sp. CCM 9210]MDQ1829539.1 ABC transporter permease [Massilia sp. CCM 9029]MDQ1923124.1 ABC transporter permease [Massilia sp. CCM 9206]